MRRFTILMFVLLSGSLTTGCRDADVEPRSATLPFVLDHNRMIVDVEFVRPDGTLRRARAWVDTGNPHLMLTGALARELGFEIGGWSGDGAPVDLAAPAPPMRLDGLPLRTEGVAVQAVAGDAVLPGIPAEANLPASVLHREHVVFDYPARRLVVARPGALEPRGEPVACRVNEGTGLFMIRAVADGDTVAFGVDNGSAGTWISNALATEWRTRHPDRPHAIGAAGSANFFGFPFECVGTLMRVSDLGIGGTRLGDVAALGLGQRMFDWYSQKSAGPVAGFIGANVLADFRLEVDYPNRMTYWTADVRTGPADLDIVGLTLRPEADGGFVVAAVVARDGRPLVDGVEAGDRLIRIDGREFAGMTMGAAVDALRGAPGSTRTLVVEREGQRFAVQAEVLRLP